MIFSDSSINENASNVFVKPNNLNSLSRITKLNLGENLINVLHIWDNIFNQKARVELIIVSSARFKISKVPRAVFCVGCLQ